ncbi:oligosaccharide flippase family protein [Moraxella sp. CTOTU49803]|uniref:oligosaccharide flippase family protein n=1 Tax=Moraxella sp. CTOTU49803 TaxID=2953840 RepID=UPI0028AAEE68|nr:oligosaccharide flippase family protein [Moraxella sp. CTOTU49803]
MKNSLKKILNGRLKNSLWMVSEKGISFFGLIFVTSLVAKYIGPSVYGELALAGTIFAIVRAVAILGIDQIYFKQASKKSYQNDQLIINAIYIISSIYIPLSILTLSWFYLFGSGQHTVFFVATCLAVYIGVIDIRAIHLDAILLSKYNVIANLVGILISLILRYLLVYFDLPIELLSIPIILSAFIPFLLRQAIFNSKIKLQSSNFKRIHFVSYYKYFLKVGAPLVLSSLSVTIYTQCSNLILATFESTKEVGYYAVASTLAGCWYFVPVTLMMSYLSGIYNERDEEKSIQKSVKLFRSISIFCIFIIIILSFFGKFIITKLYGDPFIPSIKIFYYLLLANYFSVMGFFFFRLTLKYGGYKFLANKMVFSCVINVPLTYIFVRLYGVIGGAYAIIITEFISSFIINLFYKPLRAKEILLQTIGFRSAK